MTSTFVLIRLIGPVPGVNPEFASFVDPAIADRLEDRRKDLCLAETHQAMQLSVACFGALQMTVLAFLTGKVLPILVDFLAPETANWLGLIGFDNFWLALASIAVCAAVVLRAGYAFGLATELKGQQFFRQH